MPGHLMIMLGIYAACFLIGVPGNCWVIVNLGATFKHNRNPHPMRFFTNQHLYLYVLALSVVDLLVLLMIPGVIVYISTGSWYFGYIGCKLFWTIESVNKILSVAILMFMSLERYLCVCRPFKSCHYRTRFSVIAVLLLTTVFVAFLLFPVIYYAHVEKHSFPVYGTFVNKTLCNSDIPDGLLPIFIGYMFTICFALPVIVSLACYLAIAHHVYIRFSKVKTGSFNSQRTIRPFSMYTYRVMISIFRVVLFHFACWAPFWLGVLLPLVANTHSSPFLSSQAAAIARLFCSCLPYVNCSLNWIFYALLNRDLRNSIKHIYRHESPRSLTSWSNSLFHFALSAFGKRQSPCEERNVVEMESLSVAFIAVLSNSNNDKLLNSRADDGEVKEETVKECLQRA